MAAVVRYREFWGAEKRAELLQSLDEEGAAFDRRYAALAPKAATRFSLRPGASAEDFASWPTVTHLSRVAPMNGLMEKRGGALMNDDRSKLAARMAAYFDTTKKFEAVRSTIGPLAVDRARFVAREARDILQRLGEFRDEAIQRYWLRAFETPWAYIVERRPLWNEPRPQLQDALPIAEGFFVSRPLAVADPEGFSSCWTHLLGDNDALKGHAYFTPVVENLAGVVRPNLSPAALAWITALGLPPNAESSRLVWHHALAITYSPAYLAENAAGIRQGWPRVPLPGDADALRASAALGQRLAALLDSDAPVPGVTEGALAPSLAAIAIPSTRPGAARDWRCTNWGNATKTGVMPGRGHATARPYGAGEEATAAQAALLGATTQDIGLNGASYWKNIPEKVWEVHIGGYQVLKKWLSYRDGSILQRALTPEEVAHVQATARRLAAILLMGPELDASFRACAAAHVPLKAP
jgi:hypothetical protein